MSKTKEKNTRKGKSASKEEVIITFKDTKGKRMELKVPKGTSLKEFLAKRGYVHQKGVILKLNDKMIKFNDEGEMLDDAELTENAVLILAETFTGGR